jgi:prolyl-tRNA synthetase
MTTGANEDGFHLKNISVGRDLEGVKWADLRTVREGELSANGQPLKIQCAIEVGHVFKLGTKYSEALESSFIDEDGQRHPPVMGCYGLGVTRTLQAIIECSHDDNGIIWPVSVAPYKVVVTPLDIKPESDVMRAAQTIYDELTAQGVDVLLDDRDERPGSKFKDSELIGIPLRVTVGGKSLANGEVELTVRREGGKTPIPVGEAVACVLELL